jgi:hypothetical protein
VTFFADFTPTEQRLLHADASAPRHERRRAAGGRHRRQRPQGGSARRRREHERRRPVGDAWVQYDTGTRNGFVARLVDAIANVAFNASDATNPRIDQIGCSSTTRRSRRARGQHADARDPAGHGDRGATLDNRTGAAAAPNDWMRLADILVPATSTSVTTANIRDRRPWARGRTSIALTSGNKTTASVSLVEIDTVNLKPRIECSGNPVRLRLVGVAQHSTASFIQGTFFMDGAAIDSTGAIAAYPFVTGQTGASLGLQWDYVAVPPAGSHLFSPAWVTGSATATLLADGGPIHWC